MTFQIRLLAAGLMCFTVGCGSGQAQPASQPGSASAKAAVPSAAVGQSPAAGKPSAAAKVRLETLNVALAGAGGAAVLPLTIGQRFFAENGFEVKTTQTLGNVAMPGLVNGDLDFYNDATPAVRAAVQGLPVKIVGASVKTTGPFLVATNDIKTLADLKGKRVALAVAGGIYDLLMQQLLRKNGMELGKDVEKTHLQDTPTRLAAMTNHSVDAAVVAAPTQFQIKDFGFHVLVNFAEEVPFLSSGWSTSVKKIETNPEQIKRYLRAFIQSMEYLQTHKAEVVPAIAKELQINEQQASEEYDLDKPLWKHGTIPEDEMRLGLTFLQQDGTIQGELPPLSKVADFSLLLAVQKELGFN